MGSELDCALDLMRRLPPAQIEDNLAGLIDLAPDLIEDLLSAVDQPLKIAFDPVSKRDYLLCDYNRDADSYRSPWSNKYDPPLSDGMLPSANLRKFEIELNDVFDIYRNLYYEGGISSAYCWDVDDGFAAVVLIKKTQDQSKKGQPMRGAWDSIHVVEVKENKDRAKYKLTSTIMLTIDTTTEQTGAVSLAGSLTRQSEKEGVVSAETTHIVHIGRLIEDAENKMREALDAIYFAKTREISDTLRNVVGQAEMDRRKKMSSQIGDAMARKGN
jgi:capping protein beta